MLFLYIMCIVKFKLKNFKSYKDEAELLEAADDVDKVYMEEVLPGKMKFNLESIKDFSFFGDIATMFRTVFAVLGKEYK